jgi:pimeloyl-ACP methyl ester carboxylesterase
MPPRAIAALWRRLMVEGLGYKRFVAQAGDWGSIVTSWLALDYPADVAAIHLNMIAFRPNLGPAAPPLSADEKAWIERTRRRLADEGGYMAIQSTKPQSLAFGLSDSPIGLAAWIVEKFHGWPGAKPDQPPPFSMDELITNLMLYWLTNSIASANWMYWAARHLPGGIVLGPGEKVAVPTGFCLPPFDLFPVPPDSWLSRAYNLAHRVDLARGGHFVALEQPAELAADIRRFFRQFR